jgi:hypothetical protein
VLSNSVNNQRQTTAEEASWGFEVALRPDETFGLFVMARARVVWKALRSSGAGSRAFALTALRA